MKKIALVNHRYGLEVTGGSELECRLLAKRLSAYYETEVITTCAIDDGTWANYYPEGVQDIEGIKVRRFPTAKDRDWSDYNRLKDMVENPDKHIYEDEVQWVMNQGPYSPELFDYLHRAYNQYDAVIFMTYLYYTSAICMLGIPNALFIPTAHDETAIYLPIYERVFDEAKGYFYNTYEEKEFLEKKFPNVKNKPNITGVFGLDIVDCSKLPDVTEKFALNSPYVLYAGRITPAKGCDILIDNFLEYKKKNKNDLKLVLIGKNDMSLPQTDDIVFLGFVSDEEKMALMRKARAFLIASHFESLSIVVLEALSVETPVLVTSQCPVLKGHVDRSEAGYSFSTYEEFEKAINLFLYDDEKYKLMGEKGRRYIEENYTWDKIITSMRSIIDSLQYKASQEKKEILENEDVYYKRVLYPAFEKNNIAIIMASDNNYVSILSVALQSVMEKAKEDNNYDVIILSDRINDVHKDMLRHMFNGKTNFSLRFIEVASILDKYNFEFNNVQLSRATFMRLIIPDVFKEYKRVLYLDCDIVTLRDVSEIYEMELGDNMIGAVRDPHIIEVWKFRKNIKEYILDTLKLNSPMDYFNAGVLVINVQKLKEQYTADKLFEIATSRKWMWEDQDVLNYIAKGKVKYLDAEWNMFWVNCQRVNQMMLINPEYIEARHNPNLIHYAGGAMPVNRQGDLFSYYWWECARETPFYEMILMKMCNKASNPVYVNLNQQKDNILCRKIKGLFRNAKMYGIAYTTKLLGVYIKSLFVVEKSQRHAYIDSRTQAMLNQR